MFKWILLLFFLTYCSCSGDNDLSNEIRASVPKLTTNDPISIRVKVALRKFLKEPPIPQFGCQLCEDGVGHVINYRKSGANRASMATLLFKICTLLDGSPSVVCQGNVDIHLDTILYIIDNKKDLTPKKVCSIYFQRWGCTDPNAKKWLIGLPVEAKNKNNEGSQSNDQNDLKILHLTDVHYDPLYKAGTNAKCDLPLCCEERNGIPEDPFNYAGEWGDYNSCDMPHNSFVNLMAQVRNVEKNLDFVYFTGDIVSHKGWETSKISNLGTIRKFYDLLNKNFANVSIYPILGNHEPHPTNFYSSDKIGTGNVDVSTKWIFDFVSDYWMKWLPSSTLQTIKKGGYYTVLVRPGFRIIGLNSNVCFIPNLWLMYDDEDPYDQLKWLVGVLTEAEKNNEKVHILSHIPPGYEDCHIPWGQNFNKIIKRFANIISAHFNGHTHFDEIKLFKSDDNANEVINVAFNGGSFTSFVGLNPNFRIYHVNDKDMSVADYDQYTFKLDEANKNKSKSPNWYKLYSFKEAYGLPNLDYKNLQVFNEKLLNDSKLAKQYYEFYVRESTAQLKTPCTGECIDKKICRISTTDPVETIKCGVDY